MYDVQCAWLVERQSPQLEPRTFVAAYLLHWSYRQLYTVPQIHYAEHLSIQGIQDRLCWSGIVLSVLDYALTYLGF